MEIIKRGKFYSKINKIVHSGRHILIAIVIIIKPDRLICARIFRASCFSISGISNIIDDLEYVFIAPFISFKWVLVNSESHTVYEEIGAPWLNLHLIVMMVLIG